MLETVLKVRRPPMSDLIEQAREVFRRSGMRLTPQRRTILEVLAQSEVHLDAEELHHRAQARDPNISLATVYRTLATLRELGFIHQRHLTPDGQRGYYEIADQQHFHFTCVGCGRVIEFDTPLITEIQNGLADELGVKVVKARLYLEGYCAVCADKHATENGIVHLKR
jgi:Fur family ferric uptake transcriptional regulator